MTVTSQIAKDLLRARYGCRWTPEEELRLERMFYQKVPYWEIAEKLRRPCTAVLSKLSHRQILYWNGNARQWEFHGYVVATYREARQYDIDMLSMAASGRQQNLPY